MQSNTISARHREQLINEPEWAIHCWQSAFDSGSIYLSKENLEKALPLLGFAFECAEIMRTAQLVGAELADEIYLQSALSLARGYELIGWQTEALLLKDLVQPITARRNKTLSSRCRSQRIRLTTAHSKTNTNTNTNTIH